MSASQELLNWGRLGKDLSSSATRGLENEAFVHEGIDLFAESHLASVLRPVVVRQRCACRARHPRAPVLEVWRGPGQPAGDYFHPFFIHFSFIFHSFSFIFHPFSTSRRLLASPKRGLAVLRRSCCASLCSFRCRAASRPCPTPLSPPFGGALTASPTCYASP